MLMSCWVVVGLWVLRSLGLWVSGAIGLWVYRSMLVYGLMGLWVYGSLVRVNELCGLCQIHY